jgi:cell division protein FtsL
MMRLNLLLVLAVVASALYLVNLQYQSRQLFSELDRARSQTHKLEVENERLQVEKRAQATSARIEKLAKSGLQMRAANPAITTYVSYAASAASAAAPGPSPSGSGALR